MYEIKIERIVSLIVKVFSIFGFWRDGSSRKSINALYKIGHIFMFFFGSVYFTLSIALGAFINEDKNQSLYLGVMGICALVQSAKTIFIYLRRNEASVWLNENCIHSVMNENDFKIINQKVNLFRKFSLAVIGLLTMLFFIFLFFPIFSSGRNLFINIWFPLDWKNNFVWYCMANLYLIITSLYNLHVFTLSIIIWYLMLNCSIQYQVLGSNLRNLGVRIATKKLISENSFLQDLIVFIETHQKVQR